MNIRERLQEIERQLLSPQATKSAETRGRRKPMAEDDMRTPFQRDRDRIIHSKAFRRLIHKTQVFLAPAGDHYRTRLTHTLEVSQVARTIARSLAMNEDLVEAAALGHDVGHTPYGHAGERVLDKLYRRGFKHAEQSVRVVDIIEDLNLTWEVRNAIVSHSKPRSGLADGHKPATLEGQIVRLSDALAYLNHDIDDAVRAGIITLKDLPQDSLAVLGQAHGERVGNMIRDVIAFSQDQIAFSPTFLEATDKLREAMFELVYMNRRAKAEEDKVEGVLTALWNHYLKHPEDLPQQFRYEADLETGVKDYIAGMTDRFASETYTKLFIPRSFPVQPVQ